MEIFDYESNISLYFFLDHTKLNVWVQDGNPKYSFLLKFALSEKNFKNTLVMFVVSMKTPWNIMDQLESWATLLQDYIDNLPIPSEDLREYRQNCKCRLLNSVKKQFLRQLNYHH